MNNRLCGQFAIALCCALSVGLADAVCLDADDASNPCRYPAGDAWCAARDGSHRYAYKDECGQEKTQTEGRPTARPLARPAPGDPVAVWNCAQAKTTVERLICNNPDIRAQDARMGALYAELQGLGQSPERSQKDWLKNQRNPCGDTDCLRAVYAERIRYFESLASREGVAGEPAAPPITRAPAVRPPASVPKQTEQPSLTAAEPAIPDAAAPETALATTPGPEPTPATPTPGSQTGIPELPPPEVSFPYPAGHRPQPDHRPSPSMPGLSLVLAGAAVLAIAVGLFAWRHRPRNRPALESSRGRLAPFAQRWRARLGSWTRDLQRQRAKVSAPIPHRVPAMIHTQSSRPDTVQLPVDTLARLRALALPGESLSSVVTRAVAALESAPERPASAVLSRLQTLETRLAYLEREGAAKGTDPAGRDL